MATRKGSPPQVLLLVEDMSVALSTKWILEERGVSVAATDTLPGALKFLEDGGGQCRLALVSATLRVSKAAEACKALKEAARVSFPLGDTAGLSIPGHQRIPGPEDSHVVERELEGQSQRAEERRGRTSDGGEDKDQSRATSIRKTIRVWKRWRKGEKGTSGWSREGNEGQSLWAVRIERGVRQVLFTRSI